MTTQFVQDATEIAGTVGRAPQRAPAFEDCGPLVGSTSSAVQRHRRVVGLISSAIMVAVALTCERLGGAPIGLPDPPAFAIVGVLLYGVLANVCYTGGWITELIIAKVWSVDTSRFGPIAFTLGTVFSVLLTLAPAGLIVVTATIFSCR